MTQNLTTTAINVGEMLAINGKLHDSIAYEGNPILEDIGCKSNTNMDNLRNIQNTDCIYYMEVYHTLRTEIYFNSHI